MELKDQETLKTNYVLTIDKYIYYLLSIAASSIAFVIYITKDASLSCSQIPLLLSLISWGFSFYYGCKYQQIYISKLNKNIEFLSFENLREQGFTNNTTQIEQAYLTNTINALNDDLKKKSSHQFIWLVVGAGLFIVWHFIEMIARTNN